MRGDRSGRLTILSETEKLALYGLPDFDDFQRIEFFAMADAERVIGNVAGLGHAEIAMVHGLGENHRHQAVIVGDLLC